MGRTRAVRGDGSDQGEAASRVKGKGALAAFATTAATTELKLPDEMVKLAEHILETKAGHFDPAEFEDRYENAVVEMLKAKQVGMPVRKEAPPPSTVVNLMDALRRSVEQERPAAEKKGKAVEKVGRQAGKRKAG